MKIEKVLSETCFHGVGIRLGGLIQLIQRLASQLVCCYNDDVFMVLRVRLGCLIFLTCWLASGFHRVTCWDKAVISIEIRVGSDDEGGLTKALDSVFPNATRLLCTKHIKDNVSDHLKNKIGSNDKERNEVLDSIFGSTGLITAQDQDELNEKATHISACYPNFNTYFQSRLKERLYEYVLKPRNQLQHVDLWTNNNCESINHVFKTAINWKPQSLPELVKTLHDLVKLEFADLRRALYSQGNNLLFGYFKRHQLLYQCWLTKTPDQKIALFKN
ncbi:unnamed protein product [Mytilus coruscus]|uniref:MULE transposase domain-containing protein n=1 Tax=Mytilus coruscus TaxID=42192 RepID=A0A6J8BJA2_MYTCO|nr:unnamed protein product [Mytilus coruscus]